VEKHCRELGQEPKDHFSQLVVHANIEEALDDLLRGKVDAAVVDGVGLECYGLVKSGCYSRLKIVTQSVAFPAATIAYRHGGSLNAPTLERFREGLITANQEALGRDLMSMWKLTAFEPVPEDYPQQLANILKAYPAPESRPIPTTPTNSPN